MDTNKLEGLKKYLDQHTFIGEFCGNPDQTHLVNYDS